MRIAVISDIHGNLPALEAVLTHIATNNIDQVICLGDLVDFAPWPNEVIERIRSAYIPLIMGNHDERIAFNLPVSPLAKHGTTETAARMVAIDHSRKVVTAANKHFLATLPRHITLTFNHTQLFFTHASPASIDEYLYETADDLLADRLQMISADVMVIGHTHLSYTRTIGPRLIVNAGSVGRSKEKDRLACYAVLTISKSGEVIPTLVKVAYPVHETVQAIYESGIPNFYGDFLLDRITV